MLLMHQQPTRPITQRIPLPYLRTSQRLKTAHRNLGLTLPIRRQYHRTRACDPIHASAEGRGLALDAAVVGGGGGGGGGVVGFDVVNDGDAVAVEGGGEVLAVGVDGGGGEVGCGEGCCEGGEEGGGLGGWGGGEDEGRVVCG